MNSDLKLEFGKVGRPHSSTYSLLTEELKKLRKKLEIIPFPFCELDCTWISLCTNNQPLECIINILRNATKDLTVFNPNDEPVQYTWH